MRLEGTLDSFGLPDILQLLASTRKTGALRLDDDPARGVVRVRDGVICGASSDTRRLVLARRIVGAGLVGDDALAQAVAIAARGANSVVAALVASGAVAVEAILPLAAEQATDAVGELLRWTAGDFAFVDETDPDGLPLALPIDEVVRDGQVRLEGWAELTAVIPTTGVALALAVAPPDDPHCSREEWGLLALVDGTRTVADIVDLLGRSEFAVMRALSALVTRGLLVVPGAGGNGGGFTELARRQALLLDLEHGAVAPPSVPAQASAPAEAAVTVPPSIPLPAPVPPDGSASPTVSGPVSHGSSALAHDPRHDQVSRPALTLAVGPQDAPVQRTLLLRVDLGH